MTDVKTNAAEVKPTLGERFFGVAAYLCWFSPLMFFAPLVLYYWKGRTSPFIGFHTVQATLLVFTLMLFDVAVIILTMVVMDVTKGNAFAWGAFYTMTAIEVMLPLVSSLWMSGSVFLGRPAVLPVLGRLARQITAPA